MSDYISRQSAIDALYHHFPNMTREECAAILHEVGDVEQEIIRCKDCKHYDEGSVFRCSGCEKDGRMTELDDFCSYAERREDANNQII